MDEKDLHNIAIRIAAKKSKAKPKKKVSRSQSKPSTEYSCNSELSLSVEYLGSVAKASLIRRLERELLAALRTSVNIVADEMDLKVVGLSIIPVTIDCAVLDDSDDDEY